MKRLIVDATAAVGGRPLALESVYFPTLIGAYARALDGVATLTVRLPAEQHTALRDLLAAEGAPANIEIVDQPGAAGDTTDGMSLPLEHVQHPSALRQAVARGRALPEPAWIIRSEDDLDRAATTLERHDMYLVARLIVLPVARPVAQWLLPTRVSPNSVTAASALCGVAAGVVMVLPGWIWGAVAALLIHLSITLDFTDGYLARLRGTDSRLGYWFDTLMDEAVKFALFLGLTAVVLREGPGWGLPAGVAVLLLYHVLASNHWLSKSLESGDLTKSTQTRPRRRSGLIGSLRRTYERLSYLDVHLYTIAVGVLLGLEAWVLLLFGTDYAIRFLRLIQVRLATGRLS